MSEYSRLGSLEWRWAMVRMALGVMQMIGAGSGAVLLAISGVTPWSVGIAVATTLLTTVSVVVFGARSR
jgi:hypothetical protein